MSVCRYIVVCGRHALGARLCSRQRAKLSIVAVVAATVLACSPNYVMYRPVPYDISATTPQVNVHHLNASARPDCVVLFASNTTALNMSAPYKTNPHTTPSDAGISNDTAGDADIVTYWFSSNDFVTDATRTINFWFLTRVAAGAKVSKAFTLLHYWGLAFPAPPIIDTHTHTTRRSINFWLFGVALKVVPCIVLTVLSALLVRAMRLADIRRRRLLSQGRRVESDRAGERNRTESALSKDWAAGGGAGVMVEVQARLHTVLRCSATYGGLSSVD